MFSIGASRLGVPLAALLASILVIGGPFVFCSMRAKNMSLPWWSGAIFCGVCFVFSLAYELLLLSQHFTIAPVFSVVFSLLVTSSATFLLTAPEGFASSKKYDTIGKSIAVLLSVVFVPWSFMSPGIIRENNIMLTAKAQDFSGSVFNMPNPRLDKSVLMGISRDLNGEYVMYSPFNFEYVKYGRDYPYDELRVEALTREKTPAAEFLYQVYLPKFYLPKFSHTGAPKVSLMETGTVQTIFGSASYLQVRMPEGGSWSKGTSGVKVDAIRTVLAVNSGKVLIIASRQRDEEEGFNGAFDEKILDPAKQLADLVGMVDTIQIRAK